MVSQCQPLPARVFFRSRLNHDEDLFVKVASFRGISKPNSGLNSFYSCVMFQPIDQPEEARLQYSILGTRNTIHTY